MSVDVTDRERAVSSRGFAAESGVGEPSPPPTFIDLFAGCGGLSLGLLRSGWRGICAVEKDALAFETLKSNLIEGKHCTQFDWPRAMPIRPMRISKFLRLLKESSTRRILGTVDLVAGGPPCQGFSFAGRRKHDDPRNVLFRDYIKVVEMLRPTLLLIENVPGVATVHDKGRLPFSRKIKRALKKIGYECYADIHKASDFGVPQERPRYFFIGVDMRAVPEATEAALAKLVPEKIEAARKEHLSRKGLPTRAMTVKDAIDDLRVLRKGARLEPADVPRRLQLKYDGKFPVSAYVLALEGTKGSAMDSMRLAAHSSEVSSKWTKLITYCTENHRRGVTLNTKERKILRNKKTSVVVLHPDRPSHTLTSLPDDLLHYREPRILTVREYARIQSFPDWYVFRGKYTTGGVLRSKECPRYTQVANAVAPFVAETLGHALLGMRRDILERLSATGSQDNRGTLNVFISERVEVHA